MNKGSFLGSALVFISLSASQAVSYTQVEKVPPLLLLEQKAQKGEHPDFSMVPEDEAIPGLPEAVSEDETDLMVLEEYYRNVATAYRDYSKTQEKKAREAFDHMKAHHGQVVWHQIRTGSDPWKAKKNSLNHARVRSIGYYRDRYVPSHFDAEAAAQKAGFYETMADTCGELCREIKEKEVEDLSKTGFEN